MRSILVSVLIFGSLPFIVYKPDFGILVWNWIGLMNPHRLAWGSVREFPFAMIVAVLIMAGMVLTGKWRRPPLTRDTAILFAFIFWMQVTTVFALGDDAWVQWNKVLKVQAMIIVTLMVIRSRAQLRPLIWVMAVSIGFFGVKGGIFTIAGGGSNLVWGPSGTFIGGNNEIGLAMLMTIPLMRYLQVTTLYRWIKLGLTGAMGLTVISVFGTHSRGALLGLAAIALFLFLKSKNRLAPVLLLALFLPLAVMVMPQKWFDRMGTISTYEEDSSAMGRLNSWQFAINLALDRPLVGGGFEAFHRGLFAQYAPNPDVFHDAHSIYFEVLGEHGFVGLGLFLALWASVWRSNSWVIRRARDNPDLEDLEQLARMIQVSLIAYAVSGAFLGLAYFDLAYNLFAVAVITKELVIQYRPDVVEGDSPVRASSAPLYKRLGYSGLQRS